MSLGLQHATGVQHRPRALWRGYAARPASADVWVDTSGNTTVENDLTVNGAVVVVGAETFTGLVVITSSAGAGAAGAFGPEELQFETTQAATAVATIRNPGYMYWEARCWETTGGTSTTQAFGRFGAVVDTITAATGVPATYRLAWANTAGSIVWSVDETGHMLAADGSVSAPAYSFSSDTNTGLYSAAADVLGVTTGGVESTRWNPHSIASAAGAVADIFSVPAQTITATGSTAITTATGFNLVNIGIPAISTAANVTNSASFYIAGAPTISGGGALTNAYALWVDSGGSRFDGAIYCADGTQALPSISFSSDPDSGFYAVSNNRWGFSLGNFQNIDFLQGSTRFSPLSPGAASGASSEVGFTARANSTSIILYIDSVGDTSGNTALRIKDNSGVSIGEFHDRRWLVLDEADADPSTAELDANDSGAIYFAANAITFAVNVSGTVRKLSCAIDGSTITWAAE